MKPFFVTVVGMAYYNPQTPGSVDLDPDFGDPRVFLVSSGFTAAAAGAGLREQVPLARAAIYLPDGDELYVAESLEDVAQKAGA